MRGRTAHLVHQTWHFVCLLIGVYSSISRSCNVLPLRNGPRSQARVDREDVQSPVPYQTIVCAGSDGEGIAEEGRPGDGVVCESRALESRHPYLKPEPRSWKT